MDKRDEAQIIAALEGRYLEEFVYEFCRIHKPDPNTGTLTCNCKKDNPRNIVVGLSWVGIQEASREYGGIKVPIEKVKAIKENDEEITIMVEAIDTKTGSSRLGLKTQKKIKVGSKGAWEDPFFMEACVSKAQRNAIKALLPQTLLKQWIERHRSGNKAIPSPRSTQKQLVEPKSPEAQVSSGTSDTPGFEPCTQRQINTLRFIANKLGWDEERLHQEAGVESLKELAKHEAAELINLWDKEAGGVLEKEKHE
jgi:stalled ribosome alternative rescue factor ArfA